MKETILLFTIIIGFAILFYYNFNLVNSLNNRTDAIAGFLEIKQSLYEKGITGLFSPKTENILIDTKNRSNYDICLTFLHELHHANLYASGITDWNSETGIENFVEQNRNKCEAFR